MSLRYCIDGGPHSWNALGDDIWAGSEGGAADGSGFAAEDIGILTDGVDGLIVMFALTCAGFLIESGFAGSFRQTYCDTMLVNGDFLVDPGATPSLFRIEPNGVIEATGRFLLPVNLPDPDTEGADGAPLWLAGGLIGSPIEVPATSYINRGVLAGRVILQGATVTGGTFNNAVLGLGGNALVEIMAAASIQGGDFTECLLRFIGAGSAIVPPNGATATLTGCEVEVFSPVAFIAQAGGTVDFNTSPIRVMRREASIAFGNSSGDLLFVDSPITIDRAYGFRGGAMK